jgi:hypothetical protein
MLKQARELTRQGVELIKQGKTEEGMDLINQGHVKETHANKIEKEIWNWKNIAMNQKIKYLEKL